VVWSSDNPAGRAPYTGGSNGPWRGHFVSGFEGGMRAPAMVRWPGKVPAGTVTEEILATYDWLPTAGLVTAAMSTHTGQATGQAMPQRRRPVSPRGGPVPRHGGWCRGQGRL
jgi:arylsulfatase A-like enzyme